MALDSKIQWTDATWNVAVGCSKVSEGCKYCYMMRDFGPGSFKGGGRKDSNGNQIPVNGTVTRTSKATFEKPLLWQRQGKRCIDGSPLKVFTSSLTDVFHPAIDEYRDEIWDIIRRCPDLIFQILTKRPERIAGNLPSDWGEGYPNVWLGVTVENQGNLNRVWKMKNFKAKVKFVSFEPLLSAIEIDEFDEITGRHMPGMPFFETLIDWAIIGGESGNDTGKWTYRPAKMKWYKSLIEELNELEIPVFFKQTGTHLAKKLRDQGHKIDRHGGDIFAVPERYNFLKVREFPTLDV